MSGCVFGVWRCRRIVVWSVSVCGNWPDAYKGKHFISEYKMILVDSSLVGARDLTCFLIRWLEFGL